MPCCNPKEFSERIHEYCSTRDKVVETDYSRFDGTISEFLTDVEHRAYVAMFGVDAKLDDLLKADRNLRANTPNNVEYETGWARLSGSQTTTVGNTIVNAFVAYCTYRNAGESHVNAMKLIGPKYGDDGIDADVPGFKQTGEDLGLKIKELTRSTDFYVTFCGRFYLAPKTSTSSIFNVKKGLMSLPVVHKNEPTAPLAKIMGYIAVDPETPLLVDYARALVRVYKYDINNRKVLKHMNNDRDIVYKYNMGPYPYSRGEDQTALRVIAEQFDVDPCTITSMCDRLRAALTPEDIKNIPNLPVGLDTEQSPAQFVGKSNNRRGRVNVRLNNKRISGNKGGRSGPKFNESN